MKLLIIEDESDLLQLMLQYLKKAGYVCESATTFREGYRKLVNYDYDFVLVDLNLPGGDGIELIRLIRDHGQDTCVLIMSARDRVEDRIRGLDAGADDYLTKPFHLSELNARLKAIARRKFQQMSSEMVFGPLRINLEERSVWKEQTEIPLTKKEFDILVYLARNKNRVVTKESIAEHMWGDYMDGAVSYDFIYAHVKNLRRKLAEHDCGDYLKTIYGIGYKFIV